jgi:hypothetical protein
VTEWMTDTTAAMEADIAAWTERERAAGNMIPLYWDSDGVNARLAAHLAALGYRKEPKQ